MLTGRVWMFDIAAPGEIKKWPWPQSPHGAGPLASMRDYYNLDSMAVDSAGNVCVATLMNGGIAATRLMAGLVNTSRCPTR